MTHIPASIGTMGSGPLYFQQRPAGKNWQWPTGGFAKQYKNFTGRWRADIVCSSAKCPQGN